MTTSSTSQTTSFAPRSVSSLSAAVQSSCSDLSKKVESRLASVEHAPRASDARVSDLERRD
eukprot:7722940-Pyramimonas_sp.AAC.1